MNEMISDRKGLAKRSVLVLYLLMLLPISLPPALVLSRETISRRDLVIDLGGGLTTDAQLTIPSVGEGPFPGVLLVHGSGNTDMDEYLPPEISGTEEGSRVFLQIAEYLSERGIAVLRYNKRGIGLNGTILDVGVVTNTTFQELQQDAERALDALRRRPEVDADDVMILGHSEGTWIAPRIAIEDLGVGKIVLMSAGARNLYDILHFQIIERSVETFEDLDDDHDGLLTTQEITALPQVLAEQMIENGTGEWLWIPGLDTDGDGYVSISGELVPLWNQTFTFLTTAEYPGSEWIQSHFALETNLEIIGNVTASVLILQGEGDSQTPVEEALLLEQRLTEVGHPDHALITYPGLGHTFYPREGVLQWLGPIEDYVLSDLAAWLKDPERGLNTLDARLDANMDTIKGLQGQLGDLSSELDHQATELENQIRELQLESTEMQDAITELESRNAELQSAQDSARSLTYVALGVAIVAVVGTAVLLFQRRQQ
jgi:alpha-beta hydrolase superfamily lysophospholipase